jgi:nucleotide-binding universal stress UspA family protein
MHREKRETGRLLLVIDESPGSKQAVDYVAGVIGRRRGFYICLLHLLPPLPPELLEFGGAEDPGKEQKLEAELRQEQQAWIASTIESAKPAVEEAVQALHKTGLPNDEIELVFSGPVEARNAADAVLDQAVANRCPTIVLGHASHSWFQELVGHHLAERLLRQAKGITIWVVQ